VDKNHPGVAKIFKRIMEMYETGRCTTISDDENGNMARRYLSELFVSEFDQLKQKAYNLAAHLAADLALSEAVRSMDPALMEPVLQKALDSFPFTQFMYVVTWTGARSPGTSPYRGPGQVRRMKLDEDLSNRTWFIEPIKTGKVFVSDFYTPGSPALCASP